MDLIKPTPAVLAAHLEQTLSPEQATLLHAVAAKATNLHLPLYLVGGFVRDLLLGRASLDFDLVVVGDAIRFARKLKDDFGGRVTSHDRFGTAIWHLAGSRLTLAAGQAADGDSVKSLDLITARSEVYLKPAALPTVAAGSLSDDLRRRDFSINTLALRLDGEHYGELCDEHGGFADLQHGLVRVLHPGSFQDDPTRLFRLVRYEQRLGFRIETQTRELIPAAIDLIPKLSAERLRHELDLILEEEKAPQMLARLAELNLLKTTHPTLRWDPAVQARFDSSWKAVSFREQKVPRRTLGWAFWLMGLNPSELDSLEERLHFTASLWATLRGAADLFQHVDAMVREKNSLSTKRLDDYPARAVEAVKLALSEGPARNLLGRYLDTWRYIKPKTDGRDLIRTGLLPGPAYRILLEQLRAAWLDGLVTTPDEEQAYLKELLNTVPERSRK
jgi:tRNA nucleotidyltransferase (CCA-adding enzyme)